MKIDLVMWTYNSASSLEKSLPSIGNAIDPKNVCHRIAIDGGSVDGSRAVLSRGDWPGQETQRQGIPYQAHEAVAMDETECFAAFDHGVIPSTNALDITS